MEINFKKVAIAYNPDIDGAKKLALKISNKISLSRIFPVNDLNNDENYSLIIAIGGDGTLLKCARYCAALGIKIFGFNLGRLGFLAQAKPEDIDSVVQKILHKDYRIEERMMLKATVDSICLTALNDMVIKGATFSRTSTLKLYINENLVSSLLADGLIISTPTGSTAYNLSAGGPVIAPSLDSFVITPICPHTLSARPLVIPANEKIAIKMPDCNKFQITADGQNALEIKNEVKIEKYEERAPLILLNKESDEFYGILREKLHWGQKIEK